MADAGYMAWVKAQLYKRLDAVALGNAVDNKGVIGTDVELILTFYDAMLGRVGLRECMWSGLLAIPFVDIATSIQTTPQGASVLQAPLTALEWESVTAIAVVVGSGTPSFASFRVLSTHPTGSGGTLLTLSTAVTELAAVPLAGAEIGVYSTASLI